MDLIVELTASRGMSTILITHDLGLAAAYCDRVVVMEKGRVVETALSADIFADPQHAYTSKLMRATPRLGVVLARPAAGGGGGEASAADRRQAASVADADAEAATPLLARRESRQGISAPGRHGDARKAVLAQAADRAEQLPRRRRHQLLGRPRRERRPGRRIRLRQVHHLDDGDAAARPDLGHASCSTATTSARSCPMHLRGCRCASASRWCSRIRPTASIRASPRRAPSPIRSCARRHQGARRAARPLRGTGRPWSACRSTCSTAFRINCRAARRPASASRAPSR